MQPSIFFILLFFYNLSQQLLLYLHLLTKHWYYIYPISWSFSVKLLKSLSLNFWKKQFHIFFAFLICQLSFLFCWLKICVLYFGAQFYYEIQGSKMKRIWKIQIIHRFTYLRNLHIQEMWFKRSKDLLKFNKNLTLATCALLMREC